VRQNKNCRGVLNTPVNIFKRIHVSSFAKALEDFEEHAGMTGSQLIVYKLRKGVLQYAPTLAGYGIDRIQCNNRRGVLNTPLHWQGTVLIGSNVIIVGAY